MDRKMENRSSKRIIAGYETEIYYDNKRYSGILENLSATGANVLTDPLNPEIEFLDGKHIQLKFKAHTGNTAILKCIIIWSSKIPPHNVRHRIGMNIIELPWDKFDFFL